MCSGGPLNGMENESSKENGWKLKRWHRGLGWAQRNGADQMKERDDLKVETGQNCCWQR